MRPFLKAGLIGGAILVVISLLSLIPVLGCVSLPLVLIGYLVVGALAAHFMTPRRESGRAAGQGALAGLIASLISGLVADGPDSAELFNVRRRRGAGSQLPPDTLQQLQQAGIDPNVLFSGARWPGSRCSAACPSAC